jgi:phage shock protein PspC (stress-responsive transcriptional regulator)
MWRIAESYGIGNVLVGLIGAAGTFFFGLKFAAAYILGITIVHIARFIDSYGT